MTRLTTASYVKIVLVVLLCLVLCGGIFSCSVGCSAAARNAGNLFWDTYNSYELTNVGDTTLEADDIKNIDISWLAGSVDFVTHPESAENGDRIVLTEAASASLPESRRMRWDVVGDTLRIGYGIDRVGLFGCSAADHKALTIDLPEGLAHELGRVCLQTASGTYDLGSIGCAALEVGLASGRVSGEGLRADVLSLDVASGNVDLRGDFSERLSVDLASGVVAVDCTRACPQNSSIDIASGNVSIGLPARSGFTTQLTKMSGAFNVGFPENAVTQNGNSYVVGDGASTFNVDIMSGQVDLYALES